MGPPQFEYHIPTVTDIRIKKSLLLADPFFSGEGGRVLNTYNGVEFILPMPLPELLISLENKPDQSLKLPASVP